jgi:hypothetical protein
MRSASGWRRAPCRRSSSNLEDADRVPVRVVPEALRDQRVDPRARGAHGVAIAPDPVRRHDEGSQELARRAALHRGRVRLPPGGDRGGPAGLQVAAAPKERGGHEADPGAGRPDGARLAGSCAGPAGTRAARRSSGTTPAGDHRRAAGPRAESGPGKSGARLRLGAPRRSPRPDSRCRCSSGVPPRRPRDDRPALRPGARRRARRRRLAGRRRRRPSVRSGTYSFAGPVRRISGTKAGSSPTPST